MNKIVWPGLIILTCVLMMNLIHLLDLCQQENRPLTLLQKNTPKTAVWDAVVPLIWTCEPLTLPKLEALIDYLWHENTKRVSSLELHSAYGKITWIE